MLLHLAALEDIHNILKVCYYKFPAESFGWPFLASVDENYLKSNEGDEIQAYALTR